MFLAFFLTFCRMVIGLAFGVSLLGKVRNVADFQKAIDNFHILPKNLVKIFSVLFLLGEFIVTVCMLIGGNLLGVGFSLAVFLLVVFSIAILTALARKIQTSCNCFGSSTKPISYYDIVRNGGFIVCAVSGWFTLFISNTVPSASGLLEVGLGGFAAMAFVLIWTHVAEIVELFRLA